MKTAPSNIFVVSILIAIGFGAGWYIKPGQVIVDRRIDTVFYSNPVAGPSSYRAVNISVPLLMFAPADTVKQIETRIVKIGPDSVKMEVAVETRPYSGNNWTAQVSGPTIGQLRPALDWVKVTQQTEVVSGPVRKTRWGIGIQVGYGAALKQDVRLYPYVGVGVSYNLIRW